MIRILIFLLFIVFFAGTITVLTTLDSRITGEAFGRRFDGPSGMIIGGLIFLFLSAIYLTHAVKNILAIPGRMKAREKEARRARGVAALTRGLEAVAAGDAADASHHARVARRHLDDLALTRLLTAQAAQLSGDAVAAESSFSAMLEAPETEFLGLKGLYLQAMKAGERDRAMQYAERAYRLRPNAEWAFESVFELGLQRGAWRETRDALMQARRNNVVPADKADRAAAALLTADAYAAALTSEPKLALTEAEAALKRAPGFSPAAALAARLHAANGKIAKAAKIIEGAFAADAHPALVKVYGDLYKEESAPRRAEALRRLAAKNPGAYEAALLRARAHLLEGAWREAADTLEPALAEAPGPAAFSLMAEAAAGLYGTDAGRAWLERAARAPRDPRPGADGEFQFTRAGWARLAREYMAHARLSPPPLEEAGQGAMTADEVRILLAPPVKRIADEGAAAVVGTVKDVNDPQAERKEGDPAGPQPASRATQVPDPAGTGAQTQARDAASPAAPSAPEEGASTDVASEAAGEPAPGAARAEPASDAKPDAKPAPVRPGADGEPVEAGPEGAASAGAGLDEGPSQRDAAEGADADNPASAPEDKAESGETADKAAADNQTPPPREKEPDAVAAASDGAPGDEAPLTQEERLARAVEAAGKTP